MFPSFESILPILQPSFSAADKQRKNTKKKQLITNIVFGLIIIGFYLLTKNIFIVAFSLFFCMFLRSIVFNRMNYKFKKTYADLFITKLVDALFQNYKSPEDDGEFTYHATYNPNEHIKKNELYQSNYFGQNYMVSGEDYIEGQLGLTTFKLSEIHVMDSGDSSDDKITTVFEGVVFIADFNNFFEGSTYIYRRKFLANTHAHVKSIGAYKIELTDHDFNKEFVVMTTDDVEARYILSTNFVRKLMEYSHTTDGKAEFTFVDNKMFIFRRTTKDQFSGQLHNSNDEARLREIYDDFLEYFSIVDELTLNRRIWSKA
ncbi:DUF3137 domain-containing protein [Sporosarcina sp. 6E9]|uniref:DUF3137 domain-containing protein n=1 Tax=Sporosarcina sp. 6E9 TaxID=2819235 RepID=UPI001B31722B|nr:DUF3137 domain-containing protein [Sporosarcina sp. 6E9]